MDSHQETSDDYRKFLPKIYALARDVWKKEADASLHADIKKVFDKESIKELSEPDLRLLLLRLEMNQWFASSGLETEKFVENGYVEQWIANKCKTMKQNGLSKPLSVMWDERFKRFYESRQMDLMAWHVANRCAIIIRGIENFENTDNVTFKNVLAEQLSKWNFIRKVEKSGTEQRDS